MKKVKLEYISNDSARKATFKKRKRGMMKKVNELAILCGIQTCAIIFSPFDFEAEVWPSPQGAQQVIERYQNAIVADEISRNSTVNQHSFMMQRIATANEQLQKLLKENHDKKLNAAMLQVMEGKSSLPENLTIVDLNDIKSMIELTIVEIERKMMNAILV